MLASTMGPGVLAALLAEIEEPEPIVEDIWVFRRWVLAQTRHFAVGSVIGTDEGGDAVGGCAAATADEDGGAAGGATSVADAEDVARWRGRPVRGLVRSGLSSGNPVVRAAALACLNGSIRPGPSAWDGKATDPFREAARRERTCFVGHFDEAARWRDAGDPVTIVELDPQPGDVRWEDADAELARASLVFITGFTLLNGTFDQVITRTPNARRRILMGPSVPCSATLLEFGIHVVAGSLVTDARRLLDYFHRGGDSVRKAPPGSFRRINITGDSARGDCHRPRATST